MGSKSAEWNSFDQPLLRARACPLLSLTGRFRKFWSLKEAYTKGRGDGLGFEFNRCSFKYVDGDGAGGFESAKTAKGSAGQPVAHASVTVDAKPTKEWRFYLQPLADEHYVSVSRGTPADVVDKVGSFKATFKESVTAAKLQAELDRAEPPFASKHVSDLLPDDARIRYMEASRRRNRK